MQFFLEFRIVLKFSIQLGETIQRMSQGFRHKSPTELPKVPALGRLVVAF